MTKVIKQNDKYLIFETFVRDLDIVADVEPTGYINLATETLIHALKMGFLHTLFPVGG